MLKNVILPERVTKIILDCILNFEHFLQPLHFSVFEYSVQRLFKCTRF